MKGKLKENILSVTAVLFNSLQQFFQLTSFRNYSKLNIMKVIIREASKEDYPAIILLIKEFAEFQRTPEKVTITAEQMNRDKELFKCFVAELENKEIIGFASWFFAYYSWSGKALYLDDLYVKKEFRTLGLGKRLLTAVLDVARKEECKKVRWQVSKWNTNAISFYKKIGATVDDVEINCDYSLSKNL